MSYSGSLRPGEVAHLAIVDGAKHWTTIGEAASSELQGYLEGALRSADEAVTRYVLGRRAQKTHFFAAGADEDGADETLDPRSMKSSKDGITLSKTSSANSKTSSAFHLGQTKLIEALLP